MDPNTALVTLRAIGDAAIGNMDDWPDEVRTFFETFAALDGWLSHEGFLPKGWERSTQILVTLPDRSQVGMRVYAGDADVMLRRSPGSTWEPPLPKATGNPHTANTYHIGDW